LFDQGYFLGAVPVLQFFFACDGIWDLGEVFVIDEAADVVFCGVGAEALFTVLADAEADVVGESYIETAGAAGEDVDVEVVFALRHVRRITGESAVGKADSSAALRNDKQKGCGMTNKKTSSNE
jgi:hypothetical protein